MKKGLLLISGGIDSPVAGYLMISMGYKVDLLHMDNRPFSDDQEYAKVLELSRKLKSFHQGNMRLYVAPHGEVSQRAIAEKCNPHMACVLCRRFMYRTASMLAERYGYDFIITGENLGQVASQTLDNLITESAVASVPIVRPLIGWDKSETMALARNIGTYEISIQPSLCCLLAPKKPKIRSTPDMAIKEEKKLQVEDIMTRVMKGVEIIDL